MRTRLRHLGFLGLVGLAGLTWAGCGNGQPAQPSGMHVVATTSIWGDVAANLVGGDGTVDVLIPIGADPHEYQASAAQAAALRNADLVISNGLGLEQGLADVLDAAASDGVAVVAIAEGVDPLPFLSADVDRAVAGRLDPHVWLDPLRVAAATRILADRLAAIEPDIAWNERADAYATRLLALDAELSESLAAVPIQSRNLVTNHDALGYFARRYGFMVIGTVIPGGATLTDPSSADLAHLVEVIRAANVHAIFAESIESTALSEAVAEELGTGVEVVELFTGSLGPPGSGAETLIDLLRTSARRIAGALS
jgi:zinc/manganese transport system substrate-binding protein